MVDIAAASKGHVEAVSTQLAEAHHFKKPVVSPLRYPGGKAALSASPDASSRKRPSRRHLRRALCGGCRRRTRLAGDGAGQPDRDQ